jgi:hypothetical protein
MSIDNKTFQAMQGTNLDKAARKAAYAEGFEGKQEGDYGSVAVREAWRLLKLIEGTELADILEQVAPQTFAEIREVLK